MQQGADPGPDLAYIASLLDQHDPGPAADENATPPNLVLTPTSWKQDHWLKPPPDLAADFQSDPEHGRARRNPGLDQRDRNLGDLLGERPWRLSRELTTANADPVPALERRNGAASSPDRFLVQDNVVLQRRFHELQFDLQAAAAARTDLQQKLDASRSREQAAHDDLAKCGETIRELRRINQSLVEERALLEAKTGSQLRKDDRVRSRLEAEIARQKDLVRDVTDEAARLRAALQEAANETELCVQREKENWARAEALRNEQLIQRLKQEASQVAGSRPGDASVRERDIQIAQLHIQLADQQRLLEQQQKDNERLADQATKLQELLDQCRTKPEPSPETSLLAELKEIQAKTRSDLSQSAQAALDERQLLCSEFGEVKQQLKQIASHFVSVEHELQQHNDKQTDMQRQIAELENRLRSMQTEARSQPSMVESAETGPRSSTTFPVTGSGTVSNELVARQQLAHHLQRAAELGVDVPPHMPRIHQQPGGKHSVARKSTDPVRTSISSSTSSKTKTIKKQAAARKSAKRSQTRSPVRRYLPPTSWR